MYNFTEILYDNSPSSQSTTYSYIKLKDTLTSPFDPSSSNIRTALAASVLECQILWVMFLLITYKYRSEYEDKMIYKVQRREDMREVPSMFYKTYPRWCYVCEATASLTQHHRERWYSILSVVQFLVSMLYSVHNIILLKIL